MHAVNRNWTDLRKKIEQETMQPGGSKVLINFLIFGFFSSMDYAK